MELLEQGRVVLLCNEERDMYLTASGYNNTVMLSSDGESDDETSSKSVLWTVEAVERRPNWIRLRNCFTDNYLAISDGPSFLEGDGDNVFQSSSVMKHEDLEWNPAKGGSDSSVTLRSCLGTCLSGRWTYPVVTHQQHDGSPAFNWTISTIDVDEVHIDSKEDVGSLLGKSSHYSSSSLLLPQYKDNQLQLASCLAYCSLYPKDYTFIREVLVNQWLAEGLLSATTGDESGDEAEKKGNCYFNELLLKGVFQSPIYAFGGSDNESQRVMNLYSCVGQPLAFEEACSLASRQVAIFDRRVIDSNELPVDAKYVAFHKNGLSKFNIELVSKKLRKATTLISFNPHWGELVPRDVQMRFRGLRLLDLSGCWFEAFESSFSSLYNLRYLALSRNRLIKNLHLHHSLQTLAVDGCVLLEEIKFQSCRLRHLYLTTKQMRLEFLDFFSDLSSLRILEISHCPGMRHFEKTWYLHQLRILRIFECPNLVDLDSFRMPFVGKIQEMVLHNCANLDLRRLERSHKWVSLTYLELIGLPKLAELPSWLSTATSLKYIMISDCEILTQLTDHVMQGLNSLEKFCIYSCPRIEYLPGVLFKLPSLLTLDIRRCPSLCIDTTHLPAGRLLVYRDGQRLFQYQIHNLAKGNEAQASNTYLNRSLPYFSLKSQSFKDKPKFRLWNIVALVVKAIVRIEVMVRETYKNREEMKLYIYLFPKDYEFEREALVQLWMAMGYLGKFMEYVGNRCFDMLSEEQYILTSRIDVVTAKCKYKVNVDKAKEFLNRIQTIKDEYGHYTILNDKVSANKITNESSLHVSVLSDCIIEHALEKLMVSFRGDMRTLLFICSHGSSLKQISSSMFLALKSLEALDLSRNHLIELPSSIGDLKQLRYLDVSLTLLERLPESIDGLQQLQTLKFRECKHLRQLPKDMKRLTNLRHLDFDVLGQLTVMPKGIGALTELRTLSAFIVDAEEVCSIQELENLTYLSGSLCISGLENHSRQNVPDRNFLENKRHLTELQLRWSDFKSYNTEIRQGAYGLMYNCLEPSSCLEKLEILFYPGLNLPFWIGEGKFDKLMTITFYKCENNELDVHLGTLPNLKYLNIIHMDSVTMLDGYVRGYKGRCAFPKLENLIIDSMWNLATWTHIKKHDCALLSKFVIRKCPNLDSLHFLPWLPSLKHLEISECTKFSFQPDEGKLSTSVETLIIDDCPLLKESCSKGGADWDKIEHVPHIWIDFEDIHNGSEDKNSPTGTLSEDESPSYGSLDFEMTSIEDSGWSLSNPRTTSTLRPSRSQIKLECNSRFHQ